MQRERGATGLIAFSDVHYDKLCIPNRLFFDEKRGLFPLLQHYKFTVEENTPIEQEVALDPELLGKVFENLLAAYNPETGATARKQTGSYYTPRAIVDYMVEAAIVAALTQRCGPTDGDVKLWEERLHYLMDYAQAFDDANAFFDAAETDSIVRAISDLKILDPAVGSGAFPMGTYCINSRSPSGDSTLTILGGSSCRRSGHSCAPKSLLIHVTTRLAVKNSLASTKPSNATGIQTLDGSSTSSKTAFSVWTSNRSRAKSPNSVFFISLAIEQAPDRGAANFGIKPLPNLETRFLAANTLIGLESERTLTSRKAQSLERELRDNRERHFHATTRSRKLACRRTESKLRAELATELRGIGMPADDAEKLARWDPYSQNATAGWFDPEWMFGVSDGYDVVIGNPPYVDSEMMTKTQPELRQTYKSSYQSAKGNWDLFIVFIERGIQLQKEEGIISYIVPNKLIGATYAKTLRNMLMDYSVLEIRDYSGISVFAESDVYPVVFAIRKTDRKSDVSMIVMANLEESFIYNRVPIELFYRDVYWDRFFVSEDQLQVIVKCLSFPSLESFFEIGAAATVSEAYALKESIREYSTDLSAIPFKKLN